MTNRETPALAAVLTERLRQITSEGYSAEHDDQLQSSEVARAAACYLCRTDALMLNGTRLWPRGLDFKPSDYRRVLIKACALALAELERYDRAAKVNGEGPAFTLHSFSGSMASGDREARS